MSESEHDAVLPMPGAPISVVADWHNAPGTGAYEIPPVETVAAYEKVDGELVAKVLTPPARPRATRGRRAATPAGGEQTGETDGEQQAETGDQDEDEAA